MHDERLIPRRLLLKTVAALGLVGAFGPKPLSWAQDLGSGERLATTGAAGLSEYGFLIKVRNCVNCGRCVQACRFWSRTPDDLESRRKITAYANGAGREFHVSTSCNHCAEPFCARVCPAQAITKGVGGIVTVDSERCIGCRYCYQACPFAVPHYSHEGMDKCDYCLGNGVPLGEKPFCVRACMFGALDYGLTGEFDERTKGRARQVEAPSGPSLYLH